MEKELSRTEAEQLLTSHGKNEITTKAKASPIALFLSQFPTFINGILAAAAIFAVLIHDILDGVFIATILLLNGIFGFVQEYRAEKSLEKLKNLITPLSRVIRDGKELQIPTAEIVPSDIVIIAEGDRIPADGEIITSYHIEVDESILTGESLPIIKKKKDTVFGGTVVTKGRGYVKIVTTGNDTRFGEIAKTLATVEEDKSPLEIKLDHLGKQLSIIAILIAVLIIPIGLSHQTPLFPLILLAISIGVAAIPEGLPAVITIALALGTSRMAKKHAIVRKLPSVETLGAVQIILTDKTGTLTQNDMKVKTTWLVDKNSHESFIKACVLGNTASLVKKEDHGSFEIVGDKTDGALLVWAHEQGKKIEDIQTHAPIVDEYVFDPVTKTITTVVKENGKNAVYVRGAPEEILSKSTVNLTQKKKILSQVEKYAKEGLRVIGFAEKSETHVKNTSRSHIEKNLTFLGLAGLYDPPREEARHAVLTAKQAGVKTVMVTGDNPLTAHAIAKEVGLIEKNEDVITGADLEKLSDDDLQKILPKTRIFARVKPEDKLRLVSMYKKLGFVVGVTGDGVNDALALKRADVGIAMGESGTDVAKEASDIILTNDNFYTLVSAIEEGRMIYSNIIKAIMYLLSGNLAEMALVFLGTLFGFPTPLLPTQILWINLVTDGIPALALASDTKDPNLLKKTPRDPHSPILSKNWAIFVGGVGFGLAIFLLIVFSLLLKNTNEIFARTITFNLLVVLHLLIAFFVRGGSFFRYNKMLVFGILITYLLQIAITTVPTLQGIFHLGFK